MYSINLALPNPKTGNSTSIPYQIPIPNSPLLPALASHLSFIHFHHKILLPNKPIIMIRPILLRVRHLKIPSQHQIRNQFVHLHNRHTFPKTSPRPLPKRKELPLHLCHLSLILQPPLWSEYICVFAKHSLVGVRNPRIDTHNYSFREEIPTQLQPTLRHHRWYRQSSGREEAEDLFNSGLKVDTILRLLDQQRLARLDAGIEKGLPQFREDARAADKVVYGCAERDTGYCATGEDVGDDVVVSVFNEKRGSRRDFARKLLM